MQEKRSRLREPRLPSLVIPFGVLVYFPLTTQNGVDACGHQLAWRRWLRFRVLTFWSDGVAVLIRSVILTVWLFFFIFWSTQKCACSLFFFLNLVNWRAVWLFLVVWLRYLFYQLDKTCCFHLFSQPVWRVFPPSGKRFTLVYAWRFIFWSTLWLLYPSYLFDFGEHQGALLIVSVKKVFSRWLSALFICFNLLSVVPEDVKIIIWRDVN